MLRKLVHQTQTLTIYVSNYESTKDESWLDSANITDAINLSDLKNPTSEYVSWYKYYIDDDEIMPEYRKQTVDKLENICAIITRIQESNIATLANPLEHRTVLLFCATGRLASVFVAGYYLINKCKMKASEKVYDLQRIYFSGADITEEKKDMMMYTDGEKSSDLLDRIEKRKQIMCLLNLSFRVLLDPTQKKHLLYDR
jgi:hypothetical protein